jgi:hypothetical protein
MQQQQQQQQQQQEQQRQQQQQQQQQLHQQQLASIAQVNREEPRHRLFTFKFSAFVRAPFSASS